MDIVKLQIGDIVKGVVKDARKDHALISLGIQACLKQLVPMRQEA